jgi:hypothetical protein
MNISDVVLFALEHPSIVAAGLAFAGGGSLGFVIGRSWGRDRRRSVSRRIDPRF